LKTVNRSPFEMREEVRSPFVLDINLMPTFPIIQLEQSQPLQFHFDCMGNERKSLQYILIPSNFMGDPKELNAMEFVQGFDHNSISDMSFGFNTQTEFVHYQFQFPNDIMKPKRSGRYWLLVYENDDWQERENQVCAFPLFIVSNQIQVNAQVSKSNFVETLYSHQSLNITAYPQGKRFADIPRDIRCMAFQDYDTYRFAGAWAPTFITFDSWIFQPSDWKGFPGGNEWRIMDLRRLTTPGYHIQSIENTTVPLEVSVQMDGPRNLNAFDSNDQNGICRFETQTGGPLEADYVQTHFLMKMPHEDASGRLYLEYYAGPGMLEQIPMNYDPESKTYSGSGLLKQGVYNYRYRWEDEYNPLDLYSTTEGNFSQTTHEYRVFIVQKDPIDEVDWIIGSYWIKPK
jgi:hypothetical protein